MKFILLLAIVATIACAKRTAWSELETYTFDKYAAEFGKQYNDANEIAFRRSLFENKLAAIKAHNADPSQTYKKGVNQFTDRTEEEFSRLLGYRKEIAASMKKSNKAAPASAMSIEAIPASMDWRDKGVITSVKDQGECGSCWSFGTAETVESYWALKHGQLMVLSEQQILDCTPNPNQCGGTGGCGGGTAELAYAQIIKLGGLTTEWKYPYTSYFGTNFQCQFNTTTTAPFAVLKDYVTLPSNQYAPVITALANVGPLAINVDASSWSDYESGVYNGCNQVNPDIDHVVQLVGYGTDSSAGDYWIVRNSWATTWGEDGYIRLARVGDGHCGTDLHPQDGTGCNGGPSTVTVCGTCGILYDVSYPIVN